MSYMTIELRRGLAADWATANPILHAGEPGFETNTGKLKIGDGVTHYNSLPYVNNLPNVPSQGQILMGDNGGLWVPLTGDVSDTKKFLSSKSIDGIAQYPQFGILQSADIPDNAANTSGNAAGLSAQFVDWNASSGGSSIKNKPTIGVGANNLVQLDSSSRLPAVNGSLLTDIAAPGFFNPAYGSASLATSQYQESDISDGAVVSVAVSATGVYLIGINATYYCAGAGIVSADIILKVGSATYGSATGVKEIIENQNQGAGSTQYFVASFIHVCTLTSPNLTIHLGMSVTGQSGNRGILGDNNKLKSTAITYVRIA